MSGGWNASTDTRTGKNTILSGDLIKGGLSSVDSALHVLITVGLSNKSKFSHLVITNGNAKDTSTNYVTYASQPIYYASGGGWYNAGSSPTMEHIVIENNKSRYFGGGLVNINGSNPMITNAVFANNSSGTYGGAVYNGYGSSPILIYTSIINNTAGALGGAFFNITSSNPLLTNCVFFDNYAPSSSEVVYNNASKIDSLSIANATDYNLSDFPGGSAMDISGSNYIDLFIDSTQLSGPDSVWMTRDDAFTLTYNSPLKEAAYYLSGVDNDIAGFPRTDLPSIGAYEFKEQCGPKTYTITKYIKRFVQRHYTQYQ